MASSLFPEEAGPPFTARIYVVPLMFIVLGLIFLSMGWKFNKFLICISGLALGSYISHVLNVNFPGIQNSIRYLIIAALGIGGLVFAFTFQKVVMFILGGLGGAILLFNPVYILTEGHPNRALWIIVSNIAGFILFGVVSLYFMKLIITISTSLIGSFSFLLGLYSIVKDRGVSYNILRWFDSSDIGFLPFILLTIVGVFIQYRSHAPADKKPQEKEQVTHDKK